MKTQKALEMYVKNERFYVNPSFLFNVSDKTQITVQGDYLNADWTPDFGTGIIGNRNFRFTS